MSIIARPASGTDEDILPFGEFADTICNADDHPYPYYDLAFQDLPPSTLKFLTESTSPYPFSSFDPDRCFDVLLQIRQARQDRLGRTLEGVHSAIVHKMSALSLSSSTDSPDDPDSLTRNMHVLQTTLIPEWKSHLKAYIDEIDALTWFEDALRQRAGPPYEQNKDTVFENRRYAVERMVEFALQKLQIVHERERERVQREGLLGRAIPVGEEDDGYVSESVLGSDSDDGGCCVSDSSEEAWSVLYDSDED